MKSSTLRLLGVTFALALACDLEPGSIGDETKGTDTTGETGDATDSGGTTDSGDPGQTCGDATCGPDESCVLPVGQCTATEDSPGVCEAMEGDCAAIFAPVCGCDGQTYGNECTAFVAGVNILHVGECVGGTGGDTDTGDDSGGSTGGTDTDGRPGAVCDTIAGLPCPDGQYCFHEPGVCSTVSDAEGECVDPPEDCSLEIAPVCGCDAQTYSNDCVAAQEGVNVAHPGSCDATDAEICIASGGVWEPTSCGHYVCGEPPACAAVIPGCDCGPGRTFFENAGCIDDPSC